jgi:recombinational DNA repair protein RecR
MAVRASRKQIAVKSKNATDPLTKEILESLKNTKSAAKLCLKCSKQLSQESDALFCRDCYMNPNIVNVMAVKDIMKRKRLESALAKRRDLVEKLADFTGKTYLEISKERNISLNESINLVNTLIKAGYLRTSKTGEMRGGFMVFEIQEFEELLFLT